VRPDRIEPLMRLFLRLNQSERRSGTTGLHLRRTGCDQRRGFSPAGGNLRKACSAEAASSQDDADNCAPHPARPRPHHRPGASGRARSRNTFRFADRHGTMHSQSSFSRSRDGPALSSTMVAQVDETERLPNGRSPMQHAGRGSSSRSKSGDPAGGHAPGHQPLATEREELRRGFT
jgi:hypothetical protein